MLVELLEDASVNIDVDADLPTLGGTALIVACRSKNADFVRLLLERGADPNKFSTSASSNQPWEPLACAVSHADTKTVVSALVALLLTHGAKPTVHAIKMAALHGCTDALRLMLLASEDELAPDDASELVRYAATSIETIDVVNAHLRRGAPSPGQARPALGRLCDEEAENEEAARKWEEKGLSYSRTHAPNYGHVCALAKADDPTVPVFRTKSELIRLILDLQAQVRRGIA
jgi:hypothetical protein